MARTPITPEQWESARAMWESDPKVSYADVGGPLGISKQAVAKKAKEQKWLKRMDLDKVVNKAHQAADRAGVRDGLRLATFAANESGQAPGVDGAPFKNADPSPPDLTGLTPEQAAEQLAISRRAEVLTRHRDEMNSVRIRVYEALREQDHEKGFAMGKRAKILAEALSIVQTAERKAWGLDKPENEEKTVVVLERG
jgi:hypothetical protein